MLVGRLFGADMSGVRSPKIGQLLFSGQSLDKSVDAPSLVHSAGTMLITETNSSEAINIPSASAGDLLLIIAAQGFEASGIGGLFDPGGDWDLIKSDDAPAHIKLYSRVATGDANDAANTQGSALPRIYQCASFPVNAYSSTPASGMVNLESDITNVDSDTMDYAALGDASVTETISVIVSVKQTANDNDSVSGTAPAGFTMIGQGQSDFNQGGAPADFICCFAGKNNSAAAGSGWSAGDFSINGNTETTATWSIGAHLETDDSV